MKINTKIINEMLKLRESGLSIDAIERRTDCGVLHKIIPLMNRMYSQKMPKRIGDTEFQIIVGKLREEELSYRKITANRKRGQTKIGRFLN